MNNTKFIKVAGILDQIAKICAGIFRAMIIVLLIFCVLVLILGDKMFMAGSMTLELDFVKLYLSDDFQAITSMVKIYTVISLLCASVGCAMFTCVCTIVREILAPMKEGRPFEKSVTVNLRKIAWISFIAGALNQILLAVEQRFLIKAWPMDEIFSSPAISSIVYEFEFDLNFVLLGFVFLFLSYIFSYGQALQKESDETL